MRGTAVAIVAVLVALVGATAAHAAWTPQGELQNYAKIHERFANESGLPDYRIELAKRGASNVAEFAQMLANDPERAPYGNICNQRGDECAGDVRFYDWGGTAGIVKPVLFVNRAGAVISGRVWATQAGPAKRPGIVITTGSVQAPEPLYWSLAAVLAKHGYVVITYDVQTQGQSDTRGEGDDAGAYTTQTPPPFIDGTVDATDFLVSTPKRPYEPRTTSDQVTLKADHRAKQDRRAAAGLGAAYNPLYKLVDPKRIGIAGHSLGASAVSIVQGKDPRVDAVVAYDNLSAASSTVTPRVPALGFSNDYSLVPTPYTSAPAPDSHSAGSKSWSAAGIDTMQVNIRGGTHYEYSYIPMPEFGATLRGMDMAWWYTTAWFDKYVKGGDRTADARLLTTRWQNDAKEASVDPAGDGNLYSSYLSSRVDFHKADGTKVDCEDLRAGCPALAPDGAPADYSYYADATRPDGPAPRR